MSTGPQDNTDAKLSRWGRIFWENYEELANSVKAVSNSSTKSLIPDPAAPVSVKVAERDLKHAADLLDSKDDEIGDHWTQPVITVTTTYEGSSGTTVSDSYTLSLESMANWTPKPVSVEKPRPGRGFTTDTENVEGHIPPIAINRLFRQLTRVAEEIGWLPDAKSGTPRTELDEDLIEEVEAWRKQTLED